MILNWILAHLAIMLAAGIFAAVAVQHVPREKV